MERARDETVEEKPGLMDRLVDGARGSGVGTEDPNIVGNVGPTDVPPGEDPDPVVWAVTPDGEVEEPEGGAEPLPS